MTHVTVVGHVMKRHQSGGNMTLFHHFSNSDVRGSNVSLTPVHHDPDFVVLDVLGNVLLGTLLAVLCLLTFAGNVMVLHAVRTDRKLQTVSNMFIVSLSIADLIVGLAVMPISAVYIFTVDWVFGVAVCQTWIAFDYIASTASILNLLILSLDRYWSVTDPLRYMRQRTPSRALTMTSGAWAISFLWLVPIVFWHHAFNHGIRRVPANVCDTEYASNFELKIATSILNYYLPLVIMLILYFRIFLTIKRRSKLDLGSVSSGSSSTTNISGDIPEARQPQTPANHDQMPSRVILNSSDNRCAASHENSLKHTDERLFMRNGLSKPKESSIGRRGRRTLLKTSLSCDVIYEIQKETFADLAKRRSSTSAAKPNSAARDFLRKVTDSSSRSCRPGLKPRIKKQGSMVTFHPNVDRLPRHRTEVLRRHQSNRWGYDRNKAAFEATEGHPLTPKQERGIPLQRLSSFRSSKLARIASGDLREYVHNSLTSYSREMKAARQLGVIMGAFIVCFCPYFICFVVVALCPACVDSRLMVVVTWIGYLNSTLNPFLYPLCNQQFRETFYRMLNISQQSGGKPCKFETTPFKRSGTC